MVDYVTYDYEEVGGPDNKADFWHIFSTDNEPEGIDFDGNTTILTIVGPHTEELQKAIAAICDTINDTIDLAKRLKGEE